MGNLIFSSKHKNHLKSEASHTPNLRLVVAIPSFFQAVADASNGAIKIKTSIVHYSLFIIH